MTAAINHRCAEDKLQQRGKQFGELAPHMCLVSMYHTYVPSCNTHIYYHTVPHMFHIVPCRIWYTRAIRNSVLFGDDMHVRRSVLVMIYATHCHTIQAVWWYMQEGRIMWSLTLPVLPPTFSLCSSSHISNTFFLNVKCNGEKREEREEVLPANSSLCSSSHISITFFQMLNVM